MLEQNIIYRKAIFFSFLENEMIFFLVVGWDSQHLLSTWSCPDSASVNSYNLEINT